VKTPVPGPGDVTAESVRRWREPPLTPAPFSAFLSLLVSFAGWFFGGWFFGGIHVNKKARSLAVAAFECGFCPAVLVLSVVTVWFARRHGMTWMSTLFFSSIAPIALVTAVEYIRPYRKDWNLPFKSAPKLALRELGKDLFYMLVVTRFTPSSSRRFFHSSSRTRRRSARRSASIT